MPNYLPTLDRRAPSTPGRYVGQWWGRDTLAAREAVKDTAPPPISPASRAPVPVTYGEAEAAEFLGLTKRRLGRLRAAGKGPQWETYAGLVRYRQEDLEAWEAAR